MDKATHDEFVKATMDKLGEALDAINGQACVVVVVCTAHGWSLLEGRGDKVKSGPMVRRVGAFVAMLKRWLADNTRRAEGRLH